MAMHAFKCKPARQTCGLSTDGGAQLNGIQ
jgi:hypothetical protein